MSDSTRIPLSIPEISGREWEYIKDCLDSGWVSSKGGFVGIFENKIAEYVKIKHAIACINGTAALHVALRLVGVKTDDEVIVPTVTFIAPVNVISYLNAHPVFMDCDVFYNIDVEKTIRFLEKETIFVDGYSRNKKTGRRVSAIIPVHVFGNAVNLEKLIPICQERNIKIVEDATESLGTYYKKGHLRNKYTGTVGDIGCYSFNGNKIITTGGGGMMVTDNTEYAEKAKYLTTQAKDDSVRYIHNEIGYNFRLTNIQAAMGVAQLEKLPEYITVKEKNYQIYKDGIDEIRGLHLAETPDYAMSNYWFYCLQIDKKKYGKDREQLMAYMSDNKIQTRPIWYLNHLQKVYQNYLSYKIERAFQVLEETLNIPCSVNLKKDDISYVLDILKHR